MLPTLPVKNPRRGLSRALPVLVTLALIPALAACPSSSSGGGKKGKRGPIVVEPGSPELPAAPGFAGSEACRDCHESIYGRWGRSAHNTSLRSTETPGPTGAGVVADADGNGLDDFQDGLDLATDPDFAAFGADAPRLVFAQGAVWPYIVSIGPVDYEIAWTYGGHGDHRQVYLTKVGRSLYVLPIQYDEATRDWVPLDAADWYDAGNAARYTDPGTVAADILKDASFERRCSGCHHTGIDLSHDAATGEYLSGYVELNVGCESCHGPGQAHVSSQDPADVVNPSGLLDMTSAGVARANAVCGRCHARGTSVENAAGAPSPFGFGYTQADGVLGPTEIAAGQTLTDFLDLTSDTNDFWGYKDNPLGTAPTPADPTDDSFIASRAPWQEWRDMEAGPHGADQPFDATCFDCHDPHGSSREDMVRERRGGVTTRAEDNTLCLSCHVGFPPYQGLAAQDLAGGGNARVRDAVVEHMREKGKFVSKEDYDPSGSGLGACVECHMPKLGISGGATTDAAGWVKGDLRSHVFLPVWPSASEATTGGLRGMTSSCSGCHAPLDGLGGRIIWEWGRNRGARPTTYHASTPLPEQDGIVNPTDPSGGVRCIACHTTRGFEEIQVMGNDLLQPSDQPLVDEILRQSVERDVGVACAACHGRDPMGDSNRLNLSFPVPELCERCHNAATVTGADFLAVGETPQPPTAEMLAGTAGAESPAGGYTNSPHTFQATCDLCHLTPLPDNTHVEHGFAPNLGMCNQSPCHSAAPLGSFDRPSPDYDGDGLATGVQTEVRGLLALLEAQLLASPNIYRSTNGRWFVDADPLGGGYPGDDVARRLQAPAVTDAERRAVFNWYSVDEEGSYGVHNTARSVRLLQQSYLELGAPEPPWMRR